MNKIILKISQLTLIIGIVFTILLISCDKEFEEMNKNPNAYTSPSLPNLFTTSIIRTVGTGTADRNRVNIKHLSGAMQYHATLQNFWYGEKGIVNSQAGNFFETVYTTHLRNLAVILNETADKPDLVNQNGIAKIWWIYAIHRVTDAYGDVPYKDAVQGSLSGMYKPAYDKQSEIYPLMLKDLETAINQLDASKASWGSADVIYNGNVAKWKKFGYSLMLRLSMRLTKVDINMAQSWAQKAITGGVMQSNDDLAKLTHASTSGNTWNWDASELKRESLPESNKGLGLVKMGKPFIDLLQSKNDPRLPFYATLWEGNILSKQLQVIAQKTLPELQKGLPNGYDAGTIGSVIPGWSNSMLTSYSEMNTATIASLTTPSIIISYSEIEFLLAEAALRGWETTVTAEKHFENAIRANMESSWLFPNSKITPMEITSEEIDTYLSNNTLTGTFDEKFKQIHTQFYLAHYMYLDFFEAWSNWRRTTYPDILTPINYITNSTGGKPIRRLLYSYDEKALNSANYDAAVAAQGPDTFTTRVWWDKP